jgi:predicted enzyme related to lactoylglutathione lyase
MKKDKPLIGGFEWADLTVENAEGIRDFYSDVIGYSHSEIKMGEYSDFCMNSPTDKQTKVGICHSRGQNADIPVGWMIYFNVENLDQSMKMVVEQGGSILSGPRGSEKNGRYCFIQDPAGAMCALYQKGNPEA